MFDKKIALHFALVLIILSPLFLSSNTILTAESGTRGDILSIKSRILHLVINHYDFDDRRIFLLQKSSRNKIWRLIQRLTLYTMELGFRLNLKMVF